jgi:hypothetical protein
MLPDASELPKSELCEAPFLRYADGSPVFLFSSRNRETVQRHFEWLRQYAIDGVALQRFLSGLNDDHLRIEMDQVLQNVQSSAETNHRVFFVMYDISGSTKDDWLQLLQQDWRRLVEDLNVTRSNSYLHHNGRPVVGIWGLGFADRPASPASALSGLDFFSQAAPAHLQASIVGGVPTHWRQQANQAPDGHSWREVYSRLDVISPWLIYAFTSDVEGARFASTVMRQDIRFTAALGKTYMPVVFPGFSNRNLRDGQTRLNAIPRKCGAFMKAQMLNAINEGAKALYIAMFDELNEGTAIMKIEPRTLDNPRLDLVASDQDGCTEPNDLYLRIAGEAARLISARN